LGVTTPVFKRRESVVRRKVAGETFLVPIHGHLADLQELFALNEMGNWIWDHLEQPCGVAELVAAMTSEFEVDEEHALHDAESFLRGLVEAGLAEEIRTGDG
jgi:hypothetical protein